MEQPKTLTPPDLSLVGLLDRFPGLADVRGLCFTGSLAAGWANPYSDIDAYAFTDQACDLPVDESTETWETKTPDGLRWTTWMGRYGDNRIDLKLFPLDAPERALAPFLGAEEPEFCEVDAKVQDFIYRLSKALPVKGDDFFAEIRAKIASSSYARALARSVKIDAENRLMDVAGQLLAGDVASARLSAVTSATWITDVCLITAGELCRSEKWLFRRLESTPSCGVTPDEFRSEVLDGPRPGEDDGSYARRVADWVRKKIILVEPKVVR